MFVELDGFSADTGVHLDGEIGADYPSLCSVAIFWWMLVRGNVLGNGAGKR